MTIQVLITKQKVIAFMKIVRGLGLGGKKETKRIKFEHVLFQVTLDVQIANVVKKNK